MSEFDKYALEGAYHWVQVDPTHPRFNPPLLARYQLVIRHIPTGTPRVLDVGCGDGFMLHLLRQRGCQHITGIDYEHLGVKLAAQKMGEQGHHDIALVQASAYTLPFPTNTFDALTHADVIEHLQDPETCIKEMGRVLKPGGRVVISTPNWSPTREKSRHHVQEFKPEALRDLLTPHFKQVEMWGAWPGWILHRWKEGGRTRRIISGLARRGLNPLMMTTRRISPDYEQLIVVAYK